MSPEQRVMLSLLRDGKLPPLALPKPAKPASAWSIRMAKAERWKAIRNAHTALSKLPQSRSPDEVQSLVWKRMKALQRKGMTMREISVEVKASYEWVVDELYTRSLW
jgi:hypothetical protein